MQTTTDEIKIPELHPPYIWYLYASQFSK